MARYGSYSEQTYRNQFEQDFDYLDFNTALISEDCGSELIIAFDPSYIPKSGKSTPNLGKFFSGTAQKALKGLEIGELAVIDLQHNTAMHLEAIPTPCPAELNDQDMSLVDHYAQVIVHRKEQLHTISQLLVVDGYFAKNKFIHPILEHTGMQLVCKLRKNADLRYLYKGPVIKGRGRPKKYDGKVDTNNIDKRRIKCCYEDEKLRIYTGVVYSTRLKMEIKIAYLELVEDGKPTGYTALLFSTDLAMKGFDIYRYYKARFQIEFLIRDAKQHTGLTHCQARSENKLYFHFNASLTAVSLAKAAHYLDKNKDSRKSFSMSDIKTMYLNKIMADRIFSNLGIDLSCKKNKVLYRKLIHFGKIAA